MVESFHKQRTRWRRNDTLNTKQKISANSAAQFFKNKIVDAVRTSTTPQKGQDLTLDSMNTVPKDGIMEDEAPH